jgi:hypothetical protein
VIGTAARAGGTRLTSAISRDAMVLDDDNAAEVITPGELAATELRVGHLPSLAGRFPLWPRRAWRDARRMP